MTDREAMARAVRLSRRGFPAPNPRVGCVLVRDGAVVGEGWHRFAGGPHAEAEALSQAGERARGATAYVTLEPCNHHGRTPPCSAALIAAGVRRVVAACADPNPLAAGGAEALRAAGVEVEFGLMAEEAEEANWRFLTAMRLRRPAVVAKIAMSADGRIALPSGESRWITGPAARRAGHRLRAEMGAVLVGRATAQVDDPRLTARIPGVRNQPLRVVLDPELRLPPGLRVFDDAAPTLRVAAQPHAADLTLPRTGDGGLDLRALLRELFARGVTGLLVEGGARTVGSFLREGLVDRLELFLAPKLLLDGLPAVLARAADALEAAPNGRWLAVRRVGPDVRLTLGLPPSETPGGEERR
ncbi:MAG: bifunctional diaminohydroxyphosphoribosylaminopyrimidine deaminase/5-amino-6-(5-phosphoribosylamino)uracil reductase RibD [Fimbriimonadales bacterium]|nr:bifunctional diaminohydroxyphosphoribosylaminopyrimidine deaminase/5-amino-6-(5-phosphoribosylamino)uracil reductase RibD [Fimbriimonadales bacterium]